MGIEDFASSIPVFFTIDLWLLNERLFFLYVLWRPKYQRPGTRKVHCFLRTSPALIACENKFSPIRQHELSARSLFTSCLLGNIPQSNEPCHSSLSYVFRVLWNSFSYPRDACITSSQTVFAFGELWPHSLCNLQVNLRYARLHKLSHYFRKTYGLSLCPLTVPEVFRSYRCLQKLPLLAKRGCP